MKCTLVGNIAKMSGCHEDTVRAMADKGPIESHRDYNGWRVFPDPEGTCKTIRQLLLGEIDEQTARDDKPRDR